MRLWLWVYTMLWLLGLVLAWPLILVYLLGVPKARAGFWQKTTLCLPALPWDDTPPLTERRHRVWCHAVSVGELNAIRAVVDQLTCPTQSGADGFNVLITTTTQTAQQLALSRYHNHPQVSVRYFPYDLFWLIDRFVRSYRPEALVIAETELWPAAIDWMARHMKRPVMVINGRLSPRSFPRYRLIRAFMAPMLNQCALIDAQSPEDAQRFIQLGAEPGRVVSSGNLKYTLPDRPSSSSVNHLQHVLGLNDTQRVITFASTRSGEEAVLLPAIQWCLSRWPQHPVVVALRHPERATEVIQLLATAGISAVCRSSATASKPAFNHGQVVLLDTIGELVTLYTMSAVAVMGGSFNGHGGQNPLEPIAMEVPVIVGPSMQNFQAIVSDLLAHGAVRQARSVECLQDQLEDILSSPEEAQLLNTQAQRAVSHHQGAMQHIVQHIRKQIESIP